MSHFRGHLEEQGYILADEIRDGKWAHIHEIERPAASAEIIAELRRRCPGFTDSEYSCAIADGLFNSR